MNQRPYISVVVPVFNEFENIASTVDAIEEAMAKTGKSFEIVLVNDGSVDDTPAKIAELAAADEHVIPAGYPVNAGRGKALRTGFEAATGEFVCSIDADLSYHPSSILDLLAALEAHPEADFAIGSPYMTGGGTENVPGMRLLISKLGNYVLRASMPGNFKTFTGIFRCYRGEMIRSLVLCSDSKEIHLEILTKAIALGYKGVEVPATLRGRKKGKSKFKFRKTAAHHLMYAMHEKPVAVFGMVGLGLLAVAVVLAIYLLVLSASGVKVGDRPVLMLCVFLGLFGAVTISIGFVSLQNVMLRNEIYKIASQNRQVMRKLDAMDKASQSAGGSQADLPADD